MPTDYNWTEHIRALVGTKKATEKEMQEFNMYTYKL